MENNITRVPRLEVVDALRGFALLAIVLLHCIEHYNIYAWPTWEPTWLESLDDGVWKTLFFGLAGKAYATFSLMFGLSFYIQMRNSRARGVGDFKARFAWRMVLLFLFAQLHAMFYNGDILVLYSIVGLVLIAVSGLKDRTVLIIAAICLLQPMEWGRIIYALMNPDYVPQNWHGVYADMNVPVTMTGSFWEVIKSNIWHGQLYSNLWQLEAGRLFQTSALFMFGMLLGRRDLFVKSDASTRFWEKVIAYAAVAFLPLLLLKSYVPEAITNQSVRLPLEIILPSLWNFAFMAFLVGSFTLIWFGKGGHGYKFQRFIMPYGKMTLTNYITQSIMGVCIFYGFGLGLYPYTGATLSTLIALAIVGTQLCFSRWWLTKHKYGPLEYLWRQGTWLGAKK